MPQFDAKTVIERLPHIKGRLVEKAPLARLSWFRTGGNADILFEPADEADLIAVLRHLPCNTPITLIGVGSNLLVRDGGVEGMVIRLGRGFSEILVRGNVVKAGAAAMDVHVAKAAHKASLTGLEFFVGVPGTIGGALKMNAGAYGREVKDVLKHAHAVDHHGHIHELSPDDFNFSYRHTGLPENLIMLSASFDVSHGDKDVIGAKMNEISAARAESQPLGTRTGGSTFKNPDGQHAWELIDQAGCRGLQVGGAQVSEKHCNFLINHGDATAHDIEKLGDDVRAQVLDKTGVTLEWEIRRIGRKSEDQAE
jgi:UDP-N-acetylmuramate dehydrogenase